MLTDRSRRRHAHANASQRQRDEDEENLHHSTPKPSWPNSHSRTQKKNILSSSPLVISVAFFGACLILIIVSKNRMPEKSFDLIKTPAADRDLDGLTVDLAYTLNVPSNWWDGLDTSPSYNSLMMSLHGKDIWRDDRLLAHLDFLGIKGDTHEIFGSPLVQGPIEALLRQYKPKIFLEVGVFRGATSTKIATFFKEEKEGWAKDSYVLSMDTWLLDLAFAWNGGKSKHADEVKNEDEYFKVNKISGGNQMYFQFLSNCLATKTNDRIIPIQTASLNGAIALLSHGVRPDFMYIDASHANPDVFLDYENFYKILKPGGVMTFDDVKSVPACRDAFNMLARKYDLKQYFLLESTKEQGYIIKKDEKETKNVHPASASTHALTQKSTTLE